MNVGKLVLPRFLSGTAPLDGAGFFYRQDVLPVTSPNHQCQSTEGRTTYYYYISRESKTTRNVLWSRTSVCVCLFAAACLQYCTDSDVTWGSGRGCPLVVHYWADLKSVHGMRCYGNIMEMRGRAQRQSARPSTRRTHYAGTHQR